MKTQNRFYFTFYVLMLFASSTALAQEAAATKTRTAQVSFVHPIGSNGLQAGDISNRFSLNLIAGYSGGVKSFELGGIYNVTNGNVKGVQISGFGNATGGEVDGLQLAGFINTNREDVKGTQIAGFLNLVADPVRGVQVAGFSNLTEYNRGFQLAGFNNHNKGTDGVQVAGFINTSGDVKGAQVAGFINKTGDLRGAQVGIINIADSVASGSQIGLVNISRKNGFISIGMESDDVMPYRVTFRSGRDYFYTVLTVGGKVDDYWSYGAGFGSRLFLSKNKTTFINPEARWSSIQKGKVQSSLNNHLVKLNMNLGYQVNQHLFLTAGPSVNFYFTNELDEFGNPVIDLANRPSVDELNSGRRYQVWMGYTIGIGFKL